jgi:hypothetical protein
VSRQDAAQPPFWSKRFMSAQFSGDSVHNLVLHKSSQGSSSPPWEGNVSGKKREGEEAKKRNACCLR